jgi:F-type H+-transporting ATPase subunit a
MTWLLAQIVEVPEDVNELFDWPDLIPLSIGRAVDLGINRIILLIFLATIVTILFLWIPFRKPRIVPTKFQVIVEAMVDFVRNGIGRDIIGPESYKYEWLLLPMFFWILFLNLFEVIPGINFPPTSRMAIPLFLALLVWVVFVVVGLRKHGFGYIYHTLVPPGVPKALLLLVVPIELISVFFIRPVSLAVRLFANMVAGHIMLAVFFLTSAAYFVFGVKILGWAIPFSFAVVLVGFEIFVGILQAFIFTLLTAVYIESSIHVEH